MAKIFQNGRSQAVRLSEEFRFNEDEVIVKAFGNGVLLSPNIIRGYYNAGSCQ